MPKQKTRRPEQLKPVFHIFCEGAKTEPNYLNDYIGRKFLGTKLIKVEKTAKTTPKQLVEVAVEKLQSSPKGDIVWVVYDREGETKYSDFLHAEARQNAGKKVHVALSNVCFEVWLLMHFQATCAAHTNCDDLLKNSDLKKHIPNYEKAERREYSDKEIANARMNAERMNKATQKGANPAWTQPHQWNPYPDVHKLLDAIDDFGDKYCTRKL